MRQQGILRAVGGGVLALVLAATAGTWAAPASADTKRVKDIYPGGAGSDPSSLVRLGDWLLFAATDPVKGRELWKTKGTPKTTKRIKDIFPGPDSSNPRWLTKVGEYVYFAATDPERGRELWRTKGTAKTTRRVKDIRPGQAGSDPRLLTKGKSTLGLFCFFVADDGIHGTELWRVYAYRDRKEMLEINHHPGLNNGDADPYELTYFGGLMWLGATSDSTYLYHGTQRMERASTRVA